MLIFIKPHFWLYLVSTTSDPNKQILELKVIIVECDGIDIKI